jgi:hypothetical protein
MINVKSFSVYSGVMSTLLYANAEKQQKLIMGNHRSKRTGNAGILFCPLHTTRIAGARTLPHYRKHDDVQLKAVGFKMG